MRRIRALAEERNPSKVSVVFWSNLIIWRPLKFIKIHDTLKLPIFSVIYQKTMPNANGYSIKYILSMKPPPPSWDPRRVKLGVRSGLTETRCRDTNVFLDSWLLHRGVQTIPGQKGWGQKVEKIYENKGGWVGEPNCAWRDTVDGQNSAKAVEFCWINQIDPSIKSHHRHWAA